MTSLVEKFFTERELTVKAKNSYRDPAINIEVWFNTVDQAIRKLPKYDHDNAGRLNEEQDIKTASSQLSSQPGVWFFRGQKDAGFAFTSTLYRSLLNSDAYKTLPRSALAYERALLTAELDLLKTAREMGIGRGLTALETLTLLQHHGSPTRLIDVTSDWKVALYFACEGDDDRDGRVFLIKIDPNRWQQFPKVHSKRRQDLEPVWRHHSTTFPPGTGRPNKYGWLSGSWPILLPFSDPRMISQRGFFLTGGVPILDNTTRLYTHKCINCGMNVCNCSDRVFERPLLFPHQMGTYGIPTSLDKQELRQVMSIPIRFAEDKRLLSDLTAVNYRGWTAVGYSIRVPSTYKRTLRTILQKQGIYSQSVFPPLRESVHLFQHVVKESLKR